MKIRFRVKLLAKLSRPINPTSTGGNSPKMTDLNEYIIICCKFLLPSQEHDGNMTQDKITGKTGDNSEPNKHGYTNSPKM